jgi:pimeloyl-ACP methyl ester carboxylesterase
MGAADGSIFKRQTVNAGGFEISYLVGGDEDTMDPVLFLHGLGGAGKWEACHMALGTTALTYLPQLPGWREGQAPDTLTAVKDYARLTVDLMDALELEQVTLVGHSIGGWIALWVAAQNPTRINRMILADPLGLDVPSAPASNLGDLDEESFAKAVFAKLGLIATAQPDGFGAEWENVRRGPEFERQWKGRGLVAGLTEGGNADPDLTRNLPSVTADTLLVWGRQDGLAPLEHGEALRVALPNSRLDVIDGCGHLPMVEKPETFNRMVRDFLVGVVEEIPDVVRV